MASSPSLLQKIRRRIVKTSRCTYDILDGDSCNGMDVYMRRCNPTENPYSMQDSVTKDLFNGNIRFTDFPYQLRFVKDEGLGHFTFDPDIIAPEEPSERYGDEANGNKIEVPVTIETTPKKHVSPPRLKRLDPNKKNNTLPRRKNIKHTWNNVGTMSDISNGNRIHDTVINCRNSTGTLDKKRLPPTPPGEGQLTFSTFKGDPVKEMGPPPPQLPPRNKHKDASIPDLMSRSYPGPTINDNDPVNLKTSLTVDNEYVRVGDGKPLPKVSPPLLKPLRNRTMSDSSTEKNRSSRSMSESSSDQNVKMRSISESSSDQNMKTRSSSESSTELMKTSVLESPEEGVFHINTVPEIQNEHLLHDDDDFPPPPPPILVETENHVRQVVPDTITVVSQEEYPPPPDFLQQPEKPLMTFPESPVPGPRVSESRDTVSSLLHSPEEGSTSGVTDLGSPDRLPNVSDYKVEEIREVPMTGQVYAGVNRNEEQGGGKQDQGAVGGHSGGPDEEEEDYDINAEDGGFFEDVRDDIFKQDLGQIKEGAEKPDKPQTITVHYPPPLPDRNYRAETLSKSNRSSSDEQDDHDYSAYHSSGYAGVDLQDAEPIHMTMEEVWQEARSKGIPLAKPQALASPNKRTKHKDEDKHKRRSFFKEKFKMPNFFRSKSEPDGKKSPRLHKKTLSDVTANHSPVHNLSPMHPYNSNTMGKQPKRCSSSSMGSSNSVPDHQGRCSCKEPKDQSESGSQHTSSASSWAGHGDTDDTDGSIQSNADFIESLRKLKDCGWYWGPMNWDDAEQKLSNKPDGSFLVRDSSDDRYILSLSFRSQGTTHHTRIEHYKGMFSFYSQPKSHGAATIIEFIQKAMEHSRSGKFLYFLRPRAPGLPPAPVQLLFPVSRFRLLQSMQHMCRFVILKHVRYDHIDQLPLPEKLKGYLKESQYYTEYILDEGNGEFSEL